MRQILYGEPWIHPLEPEEIQQIFREKGTLRKIPRGTELLHGGPNGEMTLLTKGLAFYRFTDRREHLHVMSLIIPGRVAGDIDGLCCNVANVSAYAVHDSEGLVLPYCDWHAAITASRELFELVARNIITKQESHIEAILACSTMEVPQRLQTLFHSLIHAYYRPRLDDWNPLPVTLTTVMLSEIVSTSRTSVSLVLSKWIAEGKLKKDGKMLVVHGSLLQDLYDWWI